ncbi:MAG: class I SAM-dependent methyltransferase [Rhodobacteraceae bacterium]|nr:class I SAM-dependent methyltransferase [Paracoccaceae bacterium]
MVTKSDLDEREVSQNGSPAKEFGDEAAATDDYAKRFSGPAGAYFLQVQADYLKELCAPWPDGTVLDVGGGHGQVAEALLPSGRQVTVASSLGLGETQAARFGSVGNMFFKTCDLGALPFDDRSFDVVVSIRMLAHVDDWPGYLAELARVARHAVIVDFAEKRSVNAISGSLFGLKKAIEKNTRSFHMHRRAEITETLAKCGFEDPTACPQFVLPMALHRGVGKGSWSRAAESGMGALGLKRFGSPVLLRMTRSA